MAMTEEQKAKLREELDKMTDEDLKDLNIALREQLDDEKGVSRTERQKALYAFLHPDKPEDHSAGEDEDEETEADDPFFTRLAKRFKTR